MVKKEVRSFRSYIYRRDPLLVERICQYKLTSSLPVSPQRRVEEAAKS